MELTDLRREMDAIDRELLALFARRMALSGEIAGLKKAAALPVFDPAREEEKLRQAARSGPAAFSADARALYRLLMAESRAYQEKILSGEVD